MVKRIITLIILVLMLVALLMPAQTLAAQDNGLETAIKTAKQMFTIPEDYKFDYSVGNNREKTVWYLSWRDEDGIKGSISVSIDEDGTILSYYKNLPYKPYDHLRQNKFPKVSRAQAKTIAEEFIEKVNPGALPHVKYQDNIQSSLTDQAHYLNYVRIVNGIPFYSNNVSVSVDKETGEVLSYYYNWYDNIEFPEPEAVITLDEAQDAYREKLGISLIYKYSVEDDKIKIYAVYTPDYNNNSYAIDAFTGEKVQLEGYYGIQYDRSMADQKMELAKAAGDYNMGVTLTPEEMEAVRKVSEFITAEEAERIARDLSVLEIDDTFKLSGTPNLSRSWPDREEFNWYLNFTKESTDEDSTYRYVSVTMDAVTGEIRSFYTGRSYSYGKEEEVKYDTEASRAAVEAFLKEFKPEKFAETEYFEIYNADYPSVKGENAPRYYDFRYTRKVNGAAFPSNGFSVGFDAVTGKVTSFSMEWFDKEFKPLDGAISKEDAYKTLFEEIGLELQYKQKYETAGRAVSGTESTMPEVSLVYVLKSGKPYFIDAFANVLLHYNGKEYKESTVPEYTDIDNSFAKDEIMALAEYGIYLEGTEFKPDESITQKDFLTLLSKVVNSYYGPVIRAESSEKEVDEMYNNLIMLGILNEDEKAPDSPVAREDSVKFVIRALNYDEVADIKGIYKTLYKDQSSISPGLEGYIAIASGLKIVSGNNGYFYPRNNLTRAEAAVVIYNYLQR